MNIAQYQSASNRALSRPVMTLTEGLAFVVIKLITQKGSHVHCTDNANGAMLSMLRQVPHSHRYRWLWKLQDCVGRTRASQLIWNEVAWLQNSLHLWPVFLNIVIYHGSQWEIRPLTSREGLVVVSSFYERLLLCSYILMVVLQFRLLSVSAQRKSKPGLQSTAMCASVH